MPLLEYLPYWEKFFPHEVKTLFSQQRTQLSEDTENIKKFILLWKDMEIQKLTSLHMDTNNPAFQLQNKRRENIIQQLEKLY